MATFLSLEASGYRDALGRMARRTAELQARKRETMRRVGRETVAALQEAAPKKTGAFVQGIRFRTDARGTETHLTFYVGGPHAFLLNLIRQGTRPHAIPKGGAAAQRAKGYPLRFYWPTGPRGPGIYTYWSIWHPGTPPNDFVQRVLDEKAPAAGAEIRKTVQQVVWLK
ncbi:MAG: HK97 gp10 family phage protein [Anaerolineae bacterium]|nr:HK97 gp10 family phage protein [Anaerolineae bacterium]